ncbi:MAG: RNA degradosome polyphosphate kinase [Eubacteriales bacterium]|nr:RNA degradosome polyphosphate kinase [Eubacteriales bacterium]
MENKIDFFAPDNYYNRELSWLLFNQRILEEAEDRDNLLFERLKFLSITASNLDEFFMVRVASLKSMMHAGYKKTDISGMTASEQFSRVSETAHKMVCEQYKVLRESVITELHKEAKVKLITDWEELDKSEQSYLNQYFKENIYPVLTPMAVDSSRPFPLILNKTLNIAALVQRKSDAETNGDTEFAMVQVPSVLPRIIELPVRPCVDRDGIRTERVFILLETVIEKNIDQLFSKYDILNTAAFRIMRDADFSLDEDEAENLLNEIKKQLKKRRKGDAIRLEIDKQADKRLVEILKAELWVDEEDIYYIDGPLDLTFLMKLYSVDGFDAFKDKKYIPRPVPELMNEDDIFTNIRKGDIFLHHPYNSFEPVVEFIKKAAVDPNVLAIKQTLYRVSSTSPIIAALEEAASNGKQVTVLVELKARFDEENNINWAIRLEKAGCHVIYGLLGLKTHSKITLVVRREDDGIRCYVHLGTGNYNDSTAKLYTDCGIMTADSRIGEDATAVFNMLSGYSEPENWNELICAPLWLREWMLMRINREAENASKGLPASITAKMNSLCDREIIAALYNASQKGVKIELIVRGICSLKAGIKGLSENITVRSIVGRYLEHARIFRFENAGEPLYYMGSADWMPRNLDKRVEIVFPVLEEKNKLKVQHILDVQLSDTKKASILMPDGSYRKQNVPKDEAVSSQETFMKEAMLIAEVFEKEQDRTGKRCFIPLESPQRG